MNLPIEITQTPGRTVLLYCRNGEATIHVCYRSHYERVKFIVLNMEEIEKIAAACRAAKERGQT